MNFWFCLLAVQFFYQSFIETALICSKAFLDAFKSGAFLRDAVWWFPRDQSQSNNPSHPLETEHLLGKHNNGSTGTDVTLGNCLAHFSVFQLKEREQPQNKSHCSPMFRNNGLRCCSFRCFLSWISPVSLSQSEIQCSFKSSVAFFCKHRSCPREALVKTSISGSCSCQWFTKKQRSKSARYGQRFSHWCVMMKLHNFLLSPEYNEKISKRVLQNIKQLWKVTIETVIKGPSWNSEHTLISMLV